MPACTTPKREPRFKDKSTTGPFGSGCPCDSESFSTGVTKITSVDAHHEYRGRSAYVISYDHPENIKAYVAARSGQFQRVRHRSWRWFDFMDGAHHGLQDATILTICSHGLFPFWSFHRW